MQNLLVTFRNGMPIWQGLMDKELGLQTGQIRGFEEIKGACLSSVGGGGGEEEMTTFQNCVFWINNYLVLQTNWYDKEEDKILFIVAK